MKKLLSLFLLASSMLLWLNVSAQVNRKNAKKSVPYRANYQRMATGANAEHTLELKGGTLWTWGHNNHGQLGDGTTTVRNTPMQIGSDDNWISVWAGSDFSIGLRADGTLWTWGHNNYG